MPEQKLADRADAVLVIGGGIAGIKASLDLAEAGRQVYIVDKAPVLGGYLPLLDRQFPTNDCQICYLAPELLPAGPGERVELMPLTKLTKLDGQAGGFTAELTTSPRYIDVSKCTACGECLQAAPEGAVVFSAGLDAKSPTCLRYPQNVPEAYSINIDLVGEDASWTKVCPTGAINLDEEPMRRRVEVGSVILASGAELFDPTAMSDMLGYGRLPDVVTSLEFEELMSQRGSRGTTLTRPSDGRPVKRIGWFQCVGSRTKKEPGASYCSSICCMFAMKEAVWAKEHFEGELDSTIFYMDMRPMGKDYELYYQHVKNDLGVKFVRCRPHTIEHDDDSGDLLISYQAEDGQAEKAALDMIVLATGFCAPKDAAEQAEALGIELNKHNFAAANDFTPIRTSRPGVYACGMATGPKDIPDSLYQASAAACLANADLSPSLRLDLDADLPPERDVSAEEPKVGVFIADTRGQIEAAVDLKALLAAAEKMPNVAFAEIYDVIGQADGLEHLTEAIQANGLNRVVVAAGSPRGYGQALAEAARRAGLNRALLEVANIRDQVAWVHGHDRPAATRKAIDLVRMAVAGVLKAQPIHTYVKPLEHSALVVGGGVAGMSAALALAGQGIEVQLVEKAQELGGLAAKVQRTLDGNPVGPRLKEMIDQVQANDKINVLTGALVVDHSGQMGDFTTGVQTGMYYQQIKHGVAVLANGATPYAPTEYNYGQDGRVMTQLDLEAKLAAGQGGDLKTVVMIQCVGSRNESNPTCGRICCQSAVKNALWLKEVNPDCQVVVLYRDMRTPGFAEDYYTAAREAGVLFFRYEQDNPPEAAKGDDGLTVSFNDPILGRPIKATADLLVLSTPQVAADESTEELALIFRIQRTESGFLLEDHPKMKPVDSPSPGVFLAGSALAPKSIAEARAQGLAAAGRALSVLARESLTVQGAVARVMSERCAACLICVRACPAGVPFINADGYSEIDPAKCQGCGICAAACPAKAIQVPGYSDDMITGRIDALLEGVM